VPKEYIEREALLEKSETMHDGQRCCLAIREGYVYTAPAADVVEVVRCKDCKHAKMYTDIIGDPHLFCCSGRSIYRRKVDFDDYSSYGERKDNGTAQKKDYRMKTGYICAVLRLGVFAIGQYVTLR
jgi:hypothetical protein